MTTRQRHASAGRGAPAGSRAARGPTWRALLEAQWRARLEKVTELSLAYHDAAAATAPAPARRSADRNLRQLLRRAVAARRALADTEDALARLASGRYGICEGCAAAIPAWLLVVAPEARYCLRCRPKALVHSELPTSPLRFYCGYFTLSQQWYTNGSGSGLQTVEGGWVHYAPKFGLKSVLFIFSTPNNYVNGCYNLDCPGFVQTNSSVPLGGPFSHYSKYGGTQYGFGLQWKYYRGNWWMYFQGNAVGYYPASVFHGGPMARNSNDTDFGGETFTPGTVWPQMGSGKFPKAGFRQAAFQKNVLYINSGGNGVWSSLTTRQPNPSCYKIKYTPSSKGGSWGTYFYYGGPGGRC